MNLEVLLGVALPLVGILAAGLAANYYRPRRSRAHRSAGGGVDASGYWDGSGSGLQGSDDTSDSGGDCGDGGGGHGGGDGGDGGGGDGGGGGCDGGGGDGGGGGGD